MSLLFNFVELAALALTFIFFCFSADIFSNIPPIFVYIISLPSVDLKYVWDVFRIHTFPILLFLSLPWSYPLPSSFFFIREPYGKKYYFCFFLT